MGAFKIKPAILFEAVMERGEMREIEAVATEAWPYNVLLIETHDGFMIYGLCVDGENQFVKGTMLPASAFKDATGVRLSLPRIHPGTRVTLRVCSDPMSSGPARRPFRANLLCL